MGVWRKPNARAPARTNSVDIRKIAIGIKWIGMALPGVNLLIPVNGDRFIDADQAGRQSSRPLF
ncbi:MAG: hypothetical protein EON96_06365 [Caulobacteraceae bacterium]|nr:MAG: hypothetical protein EON96_06365 [Caulobacteraceae bacterium]